MTYTIPSHPILNARVNEKSINKILNLISNYGGIDGAHHKQWLLDQIVRCATGTRAEYAKWVDKYEDGEDGPKTYTWDIGIAP